MGEGKFLKKKSGRLSQGWSLAAEGHSKRRSFGGRLHSEKSRKIAPRLLASRSPAKKVANMIHVQAQEKLSKKSNLNRSGGKKKKVPEKKKKNGEKGEVGKAWSRQIGFLAQHGEWGAHVSSLREKVDGAVAVFMPRIGGKGLQ